MDVLLIPSFLPYVFIHSFPTVNNKFPFSLTCNKNPDLARGGLFRLATLSCVSLICVCLHWAFPYCLAQSPLFSIQVILYLILWILLKYHVWVWTRGHVLVGISSLWVGCKCDRQHALNVEMCSCVYAHEFSPLPRASGAHRASPVSTFGTQLDTQVWPFQMGQG